MTVSKIVAAAASSAGGGPTDVDDVFNTTVYDGTASAQTITNGINLSGEGGLVWAKRRDGSGNGSHTWIDTERGVDKRIRSDNNQREYSTSGTVTAFNNDGFTIGNDSSINGNGYELVSWTFRKAPKFFDVVTYNGSGNETKINHNLGSVPGMVIIKRRNVTTGDWYVAHRGSGSYYLSKQLVLNTDAMEANNATFGAAHTSTQITPSGNADLSGATYVMYLFAHNNNDGEFGPDADQDIIKCGTFSKGYSGIVTVDLGFEPQWIMVKKTSGASGGWFIADQLRGMCSEMLPSYEARASTVVANSDADENTGMDIFEPTATGFIVRNGHQYIDGGEDYIYVAIRRGPLATPSDPTKVFIPGTGTTDKTTFPVDSLWSAYRDGYNYNFTFYDRLRAIDRGRQLVTNSSIVEGQNNTYSLSFVSNTGVVRSWGSLWIHYMLRRAPGFYDVVCYDGNGTAKTVSHNLGVVPEMMWIKQRSGTNSWRVYHSAMGNTKAMYLDHANAETTDNNFNNTTPTASVFSVNAHVGTNQNNHGYVAYLFATLAGVSKVGSVAPTGSALTVDCGFSNGARFVLLKRTDSSGEWYVWDSLRGIVAGNDPWLAFDNTSSETTNTDYIDPHSSGFALTSQFFGSGSNFIFYAIA